MVEQNFDFTGCIFSGLLSLFGAVIGLAYPFILQVMDRIQNRYVTEKVVDWFQEETILRHFMFILKFNIPIALLFPFLLFLFSKWDYALITFLTIQSCFVCALLTYLIRLYSLVNTYSSYIKMADFTKSEDMERLSIIMLSADNRNEENGYVQARDKLYGRIIEILTSEAQKRNGSLEEIPAEVIQVIGQIFSAARYKKKFPRTACDTTPISILYDAIYNKVHPTEELRSFTWHHLNMILKAGNTDWLKSYWEWASQFYRSMFFDDGYTQQERDEFMEMHVFFASMVFQTKNPTLKKHIMTFRDATIESAYILPNSFRQIIEMLIKFDKKKSWPWGLAKSYQMYFIANDINADDNIFQVLCDYLALTLLFITKHKGTESSAYEENRISDKLSKEELQHNLEIIEWFRRTVMTTVYRSCKKYFTQQQYGAANAMLVRLIIAYKNRIKEIDENDTISPEKLKAMRNEIIAENVKVKIPLEKHEMKGYDVELMQFTAQVKAEASPGQLMEHQNINSINFSNVLIAYIRNQFYRQLSRIFILNSSVRTYLIQYKDLRQALKNMRFSENGCVLLNNGVSLWNYDLGSVKESDIITIGSGNSNLFIVKRENCPTYMYGDMKNESEYQELDKENGLYWKEPTEKNNLTVFVAQPFIIYNRRHTRYIKINVTYDRALGDCDLLKLKDIRESL